MESHMLEKILMSVKDLDDCKMRASVLALGNQRFPVRFQLLAMCRGELPAVIALLMSQCL